MQSAYLSPLALGFAGFRLGLVALALLGAFLLWRRPNPRLALALVLALNLAAWAAYVLPLERLYALGENVDRAYNVGMAASVAAGNSPFEHTQVGVGSPEPLWNVLGAALALFRPERVMEVYGWLAPLSILLVALGLYRGLRRDAEPEDAWERLLIVFAVFGFASFSLSPRPPVMVFWIANFLYKPNHAMGFALVGLGLGLRLRRRRSGFLLALLLGSLAWVFLLHWAYLLAGLAVAALLPPRGERAILPLAVGAALSGIIASPYVIHLWRDYSPLKSEGAAALMWHEAQGLPMAVPHWSTLDLGPLLVLGSLGAFCLGRRGGPRDHLILGLLAATALLVIVSMPAAVFGIAAEPDELHYFLRFSLALAAGAALAAGGRLLETHHRLRPGQGHVLVLAACLPMSFVAYWDPPTMDRYFELSRKPIPPKVLDYGHWIRENTPPNAVFVAGRSAASWIPVLSGRRVLLAGGRLLPADLKARRRAERVLLTSSDVALIRETARRFGVTHVAVDWPFAEEYGLDVVTRLAHLPAYRLRYRTSSLAVLEMCFEGAPGCGG